MLKPTTKSALSLTALATLTLLHATPAQAQQTETWVANYGSDANLCNADSPCATFNHALSVTAAGGLINVINAGEYQTAVITKSINIMNDGAGVARAAGRVSIAAGPGDVVSLRGLTVDGNYAFAVGITISQASAVHIQNCVIRNFEDSIRNNNGNAFGIALVPSSRTQMFMSDTIIYNNGNASLTGGILIEPQTSTSSADVVLDHVHLENNVDGVIIDGSVTTGAGSHVVVRDSVISGNAANGIHALTIAGRSPAFAMVERSSMVNNGQSGIRADGPGATVLLKESTITRNGTGVSTVNSGQLISYGTNTNNNNLGAEGTATGFLSAF